MAESAALGSLRERIQTGNPQADEVLGGGFPSNSISIIMGHPGTGKTIFAEQMLFHNAHNDRPTLYITTLSEPLSKVVSFLQGFEFFDESRLGTSIIYEDVGNDLAENGIQALVAHVRDAIKTMSPRVIVIDSFKVVHDLTTSVAETRLLISDLGRLLSAYDVTTFLVGEYSEDEIPLRPEFAMADGIVQLARRATSRRDERYLRVFKLRGSSYREGLHAFRITRSGLQVHPRLVTPSTPPIYEERRERKPTGIAGLDNLIDGGLWRGSNTLLMGEAGTGKTTFAICFAAAGVKAGEPALYLNFQENPTQLSRTMRALGLDPAALARDGLISHYRSPVELQIDSIVVDMFDTVRKHGVRRVVIDSLSDLAIAAADPERFHDYMYALVQQFSTTGVICLMTMEGSERGGALTPRDEVRLSSIADGIIALGVQLSQSEPRRTLRVVKMRGTHHELRPNELVIHSQGVRVSEPNHP